MSAAARTPPDYVLGTPRPRMPSLAPTVTTILLVDDETNILAVLAAGLRRSISDVRVITATNGWEGLKVLAEEKVDVIISDQRMPGMEGVDFLTEARRRAPGASRMMLTAFPDERVITRDVNDARIRYFLTKPYRLAEVVSALRLILAEREAKAAEQLALARAIGGLRAKIPDRESAPENGSG